MSARNRGREQSPCPDLQESKPGSVDSKAEACRGEVRDVLGRKQALEDHTRSSAGDSGSDAPGTVSRREPVRRLEVEEIVGCEPRHDLTKQRTRLSNVLDDV